MHMRLRGVRVVSVLAAGGLIAAGTAYSAGALHSGTVTKVGFASPAKASDYGWNQQGYNGARAAAAAGGGTFTAITNVGYDKTDGLLRPVIKGGAHFTVPHANGHDTIPAPLPAADKGPMD